jgi:predicted RNA-binding protein with PUA-like domain
MARQYWLLKSEPDCYSFEDLRKDGSTSWTGVRNYQARNFLRDSMQSGDLAFFYHSSADPAAIVGICQIEGEPFPDDTALDPEDDHYDPKHTPDKPTWYARTVKYVEPLSRVMAIQDLRTIKGLDAMVLLQKGSRLSVQPVSETEWKTIIATATKR